MYKSVLIFLTSLACWPSIVIAQPPARSGYNVAWYDHFSSTSLDTSKWTAANTNVPTNNSLQDYLPQQVTVSGGNLVITSQNIPSRGLPYRSGLVTSTASQKYGRWDVRAQLPTSQGMWPAIWLLPDAPWPSQGEIDIMENRGQQPTLTSSAFHFGTNPPYSHQYRTADQTSVHNSANVNYHNSFHTYSVEWDQKQIRFYVDDVHHWTVRDGEVGGFLSNQVGNMRLIINTAVGGDFVGSPNGSTVWPQQFKVDYVHAYSLSGQPRILTFENGGFEDNGGSLAQWTRFGNSVNNVSTGNERIRSGAEALILYGQFNGQTNYSGIEQGITVTPGTPLIASADAFIAPNDSIAGTGNQVQLKIDYYREQYGQFETSDYISSDVVVLANASSVNNAWFNRQLFSTAPAGAVEARLALVFVQQGNAAGAVYVDNVQFSVNKKFDLISPPRTTGLEAIPEPGSITFLEFLAVGCGLRRNRQSGCLKRCLR
jgi:beta-glucanase (GH16 family)